MGKRKIKTFGPSYDAPAAVQMEILAAEVGQNADVWRRYLDCDPSITDDLTIISACDTLELGSLSPDAGHAYLDPLPRWTPWDRRGYWAGWLAQEMALNTPKREADSWSWDITRPVAGQYEEQQIASAARRMKELRDERIAEQTRHDVAASVARHADLPGRVPYAEDQLQLPNVSATPTEDLIARHNETCDTYDEPQCKIPGRVEVDLVIGADPDDSDPPPVVLDPAYEADRAAEPDFRDE